MSGIYLFDRNQKLIDTIEEKRLIDPYQELELNALIRAEFTCKYDKEIEKAFYFGFKDEDNFYLHKVRNIIKKDGFLTDQGIHIMFDELKGKVVRDLRPQNKTPGYALGKALEGTGWTCISHVSNLASTNFYYISALDALYKVCSVWKVEFKPIIKFIDGKISAKEIHLYPRLGNDLGRNFSYGNNLVSVLAETNKDDLYTAFIGRGKGEEIVDEKGQSTGGYGRKIKFTDIDFAAEKDGVKVHSPIGYDYIEIEEATKLYGYPDGTPRITTVDFDNIEDKEELAKATFDFALENSRPKVQLRASGLEIEQVGLGEIVTIIADMDIRFKTRVFKIKKNILSKTVVSFEFGDKIIKTTADRLKSAQVEKNNETVQQIDYMEQVLRAIESTYYNEDGYQYDLKADNEYKLPAGIYSFDRPIDKNPTKVIYLGAGKLMIADSKKEDGSWKFTTAINGESVNADVIRTGILEGGRVFWNLNDGTFRIGESKEKFSMLWDGETLKLRNVDIDLSNNYQIGEINKQIEENTNSFNNSIVNLDDKIGGLSSSVDERFIKTSEDTDSKIGELSGSFDTKISNITGEIESVRQDFKVGQGEFESTINTKIKDLTADVEVNFKDVNERIAGNVTGIANLDSQIKQTESSITQSVSNQIKAVNDKIDDETSGIRSYIQTNYSTKIQTADLISNEIGSVKKLITSTDGATRKYISENYSTKIQTNEKISNEIGSVKKLITSTDGATRKYISENYSTKIQTNEKISNEIGSVKKLITSTDGATRKYISENYSTKIQTNEKISNEIGSVKKLITDGDNGVKTYIQKNYSTTTQTDRMIQNKVSSYDSRLGNVESKITQTDEKIESEIISLKTTNMNDYFDLSSRITQTADMIESKVSSNEARSIFRQEASKFTFDADQVNFNSNVDIRGKFKTTGTRRSFDDGYYTGASVTMDDGGLFFENSSGYKTGEINGAYDLQIWGNSSVSIGVESRSEYKWGTYIHINNDRIDLRGDVKTHDCDVYGNLYVNGDIQFAGDLQVGGVRIIGSYSRVRIKFLNYNTAYEIDGDTQTARFIYDLS